jgi:hypothetical protein
MGRGSLSILRSGPGNVADVGTDQQISEPFNRFQGGKARQTSPVGHISLELNKDNRPVSFSFLGKMISTIFN